jgi:hypothetical protein
MRRAFRTPRRVRSPRPVAGFGSCLSTCRTGDSQAPSTTRNKLEWLAALRAVVAAGVAAEEIPKAELLVLEEADHYAAHMNQDEFLLDAVLRTLRGDR